jgi:hypothetical protein
MVSIYVIMNLNKFEKQKWIQSTKNILLDCIKHILDNFTIAKVDSTTNFNFPHLHINSPSIIEMITLKYIVVFETMFLKVVIYNELEKINQTHN